jgi:hypothetical protein
MRLRRGKNCQLVRFRHLSPNPRHILSSWRNFPTPCCILSSDPNFAHFGPNETIADDDRSLSLVRLHPLIHYYDKDRLTLCFKTVTAEVNCTPLRITEYWMVTIMLETVQRFQRYFVRIRCLGCHETSTVRSCHPTQYTVQTVIKQMCYK